MRTPTPAELSRARAALLNPDDVNHHPALMQAAWHTCAIAHGVRLDLDHLAPMHHLHTRFGNSAKIVPIRSRTSAPNANPDNSLAATLARIAPRVSAAVARHLHPHGDA